MFFLNGIKCCCSLIVVVKIYGRINCSLSSFLEATATTTTTTGAKRQVEGKEGKVHSYKIPEFAFSWKRDIKSNSHKVDSKQQPHEQRYQQQTQQHV